MSYSQFHWYDHEQNKVDYDEYSIEEPRQCMHCLQTGTQINLGCYRTTGGHDNWHGVGLYACQLCGSTTIHYLINCGDDPFENRYKPFASIPTYKGN
ncbi:hypothetical protein, partial [Oceanobacillus sp. CF4.6]|uniref:hypothetical protein n=1 Tax=Oceanobacillus sp. CF4.6 TaxID=3373080 RepID=UPI003EE78F08